MSFRNQRSAEAYGIWGKGSKPREEMLENVEKSRGERVRRTEGPGVEYVK